MTGRVRFDPSDCFTIDGQDHLIADQNSDGIVIQQVDNRNVVRSISKDEIRTFLSSPSTRLRRGHFSRQRSQQRLRSKLRYMVGVPKAARRKAQWKELWCKTYLLEETKQNVVRTEASYLAARRRLQSKVNDLLAESEWLSSDYAKTRRAPSARSLFDWVRRYERSGFCPLSLLRKQRSNSSYARKYTRDVVKLLNECIWDYLHIQRKSKRSTVKHTLSKFKDENEVRLKSGLPALAVPSKTEIERRIGRFCYFETKVGRQGSLSARKEMAIYENGLVVQHPMQCVQIDEWKIDCLTLLENAGFLDDVPRERWEEYDIGRRWLYLAIDVATRCIVGFHLSPSPSATDAVHTLSLVTMDKTPLALAAGCESAWDQFGGGGAIVTDMGPAFISEEFSTAVPDAGFSWKGPVAANPKLRGHVERCFGTLASQLMPELTGRTFSNPIERGDYPSKELAALTDADLVRIFTLFFVDIYHNTQHEGLNRETPANAWKRLSAEQGVTAPPDATTRCAVFGAPLERKIGRHGLRIFGINYLSPEIQEDFLRNGGKLTSIRIDPQDLTHITVFLDNEWHAARAVSEAVWGLSLDEWQSITQQLRHKHKREAELTEDIVFRARKAIKQINADAMALRRLSPTKLTNEDIEQAERTLFRGLSIKPKHLETPEKDAPSGLGILGDEISAVASEQTEQSPEPAQTPTKPLGFHHD